MGDRALVLFHSGDKSEITPIIYLHWLGREVPNLIAETKLVMASCHDDPSYAAARFCAVACSHSNGNAGIGLLSAPDDVLTNAGEHSHGDAGVILVNAATFEWTAHGGYLSRFDHSTGQMQDENAA